jgi:putative glycosyltransferase (TIGR04372 family)
LITRAVKTKEFEGFVKNRLAQLMAGFWAIPLVLAMRLSRPIRLIQICGIRSDRIGHFVADSVEQKARTINPTQNSSTYYFLQGIPTNLQWETMVRRSLPNLKGKWLSYVFFWNRKIPGGRVHNLESSKTGSRDIEGLFQRFDCSFPFTKEEDKICKKWLESKSWHEGEPFVTLLVRDSTYLKHVNPEQDWSYHNYRDSNIESYIPSVKWLTQKNVWVLRMGKHVSGQLSLKEDRYIDYAYDVEKSDLLDMWLFANSSAIISTASGPDCLGGVYKKPILFVNALPLLDLASFFDMTWVPKNLLWKKSGENLTLSETIQNTYYTSHEYEANGIEIEDLSTEVITQSVIEFWQKTSNTQKDSAGDVDTQRLFWKIFTENPKFKEKHKVVHKNAKVGTFWLSTMGERYLR